MADQRRHWHLSKGIQLPIIILLGGHIFASVWWAAKLDAKTQDIVSSKTLTIQLHNRDIAIEHNSKKIERVYSILDKMDSKLDKVLDKVN